MNWQNEIQDKAIIKREKKRSREIIMLQKMVKIYCRGHKHLEPCKECKELLDYGILRTSKCPFMAEKTFCSACKVHCYGKEYQSRMKEVMRYSGPRMLWYHPAAAVHHGVTTIQTKIKMKHQK